MPHPAAIRSLGRALAAASRADAHEQLMHMDVAAFHAPSECHALVSRGEGYRLRLARRHAEAIAGCRWGLIEREAARRLGGKNQFRRAMGRLLCRQIDQLMGA